MSVFLLQLRSLLDGAEITAAAERSRSFRAIFPLKHQIVSRSAALADNMLAYSCAQSIGRCIVIVHLVAHFLCLKGIRSTALNISLTL